MKNEVITLKEKVLKYEEKVKKNEAKQKLRGKELNTVLDTGEKAELYQEFFEINTEISLYTRRYEKLQNLNEQTQKSYKDMTNKLLEFEKEYEKIKDKDEAFADNSSKVKIKEELGKLEKKNKAITGKYDSKIRAFTLKIKKLEEELNSLKTNKSEIEQQLEKKNDENRVQQLSLNDLQIRSSQQNKHYMKHSSFSDDMFITEKMM